MNFVLAQRRLSFSFCYIEEVKIPEVLSKIKELFVSFKSSHSKSWRQALEYTKNEKKKKKENHINYNGLKESLTLQNKIKIFFTWSASRTICKSNSAAKSAFYVLDNDRPLTATARSLPQKEKISYIRLSS